MSIIKAYAGYVPEKIINNEDFYSFVDTSDEWIKTRTGISSRHISTGENTSDLGTKVSLMLLEKSGVAPEDIDLIILATITPDYLTPSTACLVQRNIGALNAMAFDISAACSGFVFALSLAEKLMLSPVYKNAIIIGAEALTKVVDWKDRRTCILFGDGAGGVLLQKNEGFCILAEDIHCEGNKYQAVTSCHMPIKPTPFNEGLEAWESYSTPADTAFIKMDGRALLDFTAREIPTSINNVLERAKVSMDEVKFIVPHQANGRIVDSIAKRMGIDVSKFYVNIDRFGNTSSASIPIALNEMHEKGLITQGDILLLTGFGGGLTWGSILIRV